MSATTADELKQSAEPVALVLPTVGEERARAGYDERVPLPRNRTIWRALMLLGVWTVALVGVWFWWNAEANRLLAEQRAQAKARGERFDLADFQPPPVPPEENAATLLNQAYALIPVGDDGKPFDFGMYTWPEEIDAEPEKIRRMLQEAQPALAALREGVALSSCDWGVKVSSPILNLLLPHLSPQRALCKLLASHAVFAAHIDDDDASALADVERGLIHARYAGGAPDTLIGTLVTTACASVHVGVIRDITPELLITPAGGKGTPASPAQLRSVIGLLLDDEAACMQLRRAMEFERLSGVDSFEIVRSGNTARLLGPGGPTGLPITSKLALPMFTLDEVRTIRIHSAIIAGCCAPSYAERIAAPVRSDGFYERPRMRYIALLSSILMPSLTRAIELVTRQQADRNMAAIALAIRWYELEHDGQRPSSLEQLVPKYLPRLPTDPFAGGVATYRYDPAGEKPTIYSVSTNGVDDGGEIRYGSQGDMKYDTSPDCRFYYDRRPPASQPANADDMSTTDD